MPPSMLKSLAKKAGVTLKTAEQYWTQAKTAAEKKGSEFKENWAYIAGIVKKRLGLTNEQLVLCGWPVRLVLEAETLDEPTEEEPVELKSYTFDVEGLEEGDSRDLLATLKKDFTVRWELLQGQVICVPDLADEDHEKLTELLKKYKLKPKALKEAVEPLLVSLFLLEFYRVRELNGTSRVLGEGGAVLTDDIVNEIALLEASTDYHKWLVSLFPGAAAEVFAFLADQAPKA